jgi:hypothetical protein
MLTRRVVEKLFVVSLEASVRPSVDNDIKSDLFSAG